MPEPDLHPPVAPIPVAVTEVKDASVVISAEPSKPTPPVQPALTPTPAPLAVPSRRFFADAHTVPRGSALPLPPAAWLARAPVAV